MKNFMTFLGAALVASLILVSCGQNSNKKKELELKERELALKEKEFALDSARNTNIPKTSNAIETKQESSTNQAKVNTRDNSTPEKKLTKDNSQISNSTVIKEIITSKGKFPIIKMADLNSADAINLYISRQIFRKDYNPSDIKSVIEIENWDDSYSNYSQVNYKINSNTSSELLINIEMCFIGAAEHCFAYNFSFNLTTGSKNVKIIEE